MHVILICTSVFIQLYSVLSIPRILDITNICLVHEEYSFFLTSGIGYFDAIALMISTEKPIKCSVDFSIMNDNHVLVVVEVPDWHFRNKLCFVENTTELMISQYNGSQTCTAITPGPRHVTLMKAKVMLKFKNITKIHTFKVIVTAMRDPGLYRCRSRETKCVVSHKVFCITSDFMCDGNANCGVPNEYDEDVVICKGFGVTYFMIFCSTVMFVMSLLLLALLFLSVSPKRQEIYVYRFDNSLPLFDSEGGVVNYDIDVKVLFPAASKSLYSTKSILLKK